MYDLPNLVLYREDAGPPKPVPSASPIAVQFLTDKSSYIVIARRHLKPMPFSWSLFSHYRPGKDKNAPVSVSDAATRLCFAAASGEVTLTIQQVES